MHSSIDLQSIGIISAIVVAVIGGVSFVIAKIFNLGKVSHRLQSVESDIKKVEDAINRSSKDLAKRIDDLMIVIAQSGLTESHSPRQLTKEGKRVLESSGLAPIVDANLDKIVSLVSAMKPENAYQAEQDILNAVNQLGHDGVIKDAVEEGAFNSGVIAPVALFVAGIYIRDRVLEELGLKSEEIDKYSPQKPATP